jgi:hypothetical protein
MAVENIRKTVYVWDWTGMPVAAGICRHTVNASGTFLRNPHIFPQQTAFYPSVNGTDRLFLFVAQC